MYDSSQRRLATSQPRNGNGCWLINENEIYDLNFNCFVVLIVIDFHYEQKPSGRQRFVRSTLAFLIYGVNLAHSLAFHKFN